jgi:hypothetical protein
MLDGEAAGNGAFSADARDPETSNALASTLWELQALKVGICHDGVMFYEYDVTMT